MPEDNTVQENNTLVKMKTGTITDLQNEVNGIKSVPLDVGSIYFAVDTNEHIGQIVYDAPINAGSSVDRIVMSTQAEYSDKAGYTDLSDRANRLTYIICNSTAETANKNGNVWPSDWPIEEDGNTVSPSIANGTRLLINFQNGNTVNNLRINFSYTRILNGRSNPTTLSYPLYHKMSFGDQRQVTYSTDAPYAERPFLQEYVFDSSANAFLGVGSPVLPTQDISIPTVLRIDDIAVSSVSYSFPLIQGTNNNKLELSVTLSSVHSPVFGSNVNLTVYTENENASN